MTDTELSPRDSLWHMINAQEILRAIHVVATLGIADFLIDGPREVRELAFATQTQGPTLYG